MLAFPPSIEPVFKVLQDELAWLTVRWRTYCDLYTKGEKRIDLLNEVAGPTFYVFQEVLGADIQISLSRLTDGARTGKHENLTIEKLHEVALTIGDPSLHDSLTAILLQLRETCKVIRDHRNKRLAHFDYNVAIASPGSALPDVSREMIETSLELLGQYLNILSIHYKDSEIGFDHTLTGPGGADQLVEIMKLGMRYQERQEEDDFDWVDPQRSPWYSA